jgi:hypothetical protein
MQVNVQIDRVVVRDHGGASIALDALGQSLAKNLSDAMTGAGTKASHLVMPHCSEASSVGRESVSERLANAIFANISRYDIGLPVQHGGRS